MRKYEVASSSSVVNTNFGAGAAAAAPAPKFVFTTDEEEATSYFRKGYLVRRVKHEGVLGYKVHMANMVNGVSPEIIAATDGMLHK